MGHVFNQSRGSFVMSIFKSPDLLPARRGSVLLLVVHKSLQISPKIFVHVTLLFRIEPDCR